MPYGSSSPDTSHPSVTMYNYYPVNGVQVIGPTWSMNASEKEIWSRTGTNSLPTQKATFCKRYTGPMKLVSIKLPRGPKLPYRIFNKKIGKWIWARQTITVYKLVPDRTKVKHAKGLDLPPNPLDYQSVKMTGMPSNPRYLHGVYLDDPTWNRTLIGDLYDGFVPFGGSSAIPYKPDLSKAYLGDFSSILDSLDRQATAKLYEKVKSQHVNLLNALAERRQTVKLLHELVFRLLGAFLSLKRGNLFEAARKLFPHDTKGLANDWLLLQYGIKPLISDINGLVDHLNKWEPLVFDVIVSASEKLPNTSGSTEFTDNLAVTCGFEESGVISVKYKVRVKTKDNFARNFTRLGLTNLNATAWELIPWSFVVDWAIPIGDYLNNEDAFSDLEIVHCSKTMFLKKNMIFNRTFGGKDRQGYTWDSANTTIVVQKVHCQRILLSSPPKLRFPTVKNPISKGHFLNFLALVTQLRK